MMLSSLQLEAFHQVAMAQSFSKAAIQLHVTQSALSQRISKLEAELEVSLFIRDSSGVRLTEAGATLQKYCQTQALLEHEALARLKPATAKAQGLSGTIRLGGYSTVLRPLVLPKLAKLLHANPNVGLELFARELADLPRMLRTGEIDFAILDHNLEGGDWTTHELGAEEYVLVENQSGPRQRGIYLDHDPTDQTTARFFQLQNSQAAKGAGMSLRRRYLDDVYGILDAAALGLGRAVVPRQLVPARSGLRVVAGLNSLYVPIVLHYHSQSFYPALHRAVVERLVSGFAASK